MPSKNEEREEKGKKRVSLLNYESSHMTIWLFGKIENSGKHCSVGNPGLTSGCAPSYGRKGPVQS